MSSNDDGLVVDVRPMRTIEIDPAERRARVGAGVTWGEFDAAAQRHGLATTGGRVSSTGVAGFSLGGGSGWLERLHGLACDNLLAVDLVTADGRAVRADAEHHPDLFWAVRGGGGNFGVATALEFRLHPVGPIVQAGLFAWYAHRAPEVARAYRAWAESAPEALGTWLMLLTGPAEEFIPEPMQGQLLVMVVGMWCGDPDEGARQMEPMRALNPGLDLMAPRPYAEFQQMLDDQPGLRHYWSADHFDDLPDPLLDIFLASATSAPSSLTQQIFLPWGGAVARVPEEDSPLTSRGAAWVSHPFAVWDDPSTDAQNIEWVRRFRSDVAPYTNGGVYLNFIGAEGEDRIRDAFGEEKLARLVQVKTAYDPGNVFRGNQNIAPLVPSA
jgi:FAD/FMN-containing dehydrogenase